MAKNIFVNLPVADLQRSIEFFDHLGFAFSDQFTTETTAAMVFSSNIFVILMTHDRFSQFTSRDISDGHTCTEVLVALSADTRKEVDDTVATAISNGAVEARRALDHGWMYGRSFHDLDGHIWETVWMDKEYVSARDSPTVGTS